jgi:hypothetical protein
MSRKRKKIAWKIMTESIYRFGREERIQSAYEKILPIEKVNMTGRENELCENRTLCKSIERKTGTGKND